jgi:saccharopine dehydrogenase-like NADP-dependent oxidoreductase
LHPRRPFQRKERCAVLEAALAARVAYMDVCDDADYSQRARGYHQQAVDAGVPAITTAGIYPGISNVRRAARLRHASVTSCGCSHGCRGWLLAVLC